MTDFREKTSRGTLRRPLDGAAASTCWTPRGLPQPPRLPQPQSRHKNRVLVACFGRPKTTATPPTTSFTGTRTRSPTKLSLQDMLPAPSTVHNDRVLNLQRACEARYVDSAMRTIEPCAFMVQWRRRLRPCQYRFPAPAVVMDSLSLVAFVAVFSLRMTGSPKLAHRSQGVGAARFWLRRGTRFFG